MCAFLPPFIYGLMIAASVLTVPWWAAVTISLGAVLLLVATIQWFNVWRAALFVLGAALAAATWMYILSWSQLPAYNGPLKVGEPFPAFYALRANGTKLTQEVLKGGEGSHLIVLFRGRWCAYCMAQLADLDASHRSFDLRHVHVIAASIEGGAETLQTQADFPNLEIVSDAARKLIDATGTLHPGGAPNGSDTAAPTMVLIDQQGVVRWIFRPTRYLARPSSEEVCAAIDEVLPQVW
ncbi:MAG: peroxiredoxin family protein [Pirellulales bacterium]|nr:peroxiredoxin family protein [Pirellulales bacterium]